MTRIRTRPPIVDLIQALAVFLAPMAGLVWVLPGTWAEVCPSLPTGRRRGSSGRAARWRTSPLVSRLADSIGRSRKAATATTMVKPEREDHSAHPDLEEWVSLESGG